MTNGSDNHPSKKSAETEGSAALADGVLDSVVGGVGSGQPRSQRHESANGFIFSDETFLGIRADQDQ